MSLHPSFHAEFTRQQPLGLLVRTPYRILAVLAASITVLVLLVLTGKDHSAESPPWEWAHSLGMESARTLTPRATR